MEFRSWVRAHELSDDIWMVRKTGVWVEAATDYDLPCCDPAYHDLNVFMQYMNRFHPAIAYDDLSHTISPSHTADLMTEKAQLDKQRVFEDWLKRGIRQSFGELKTQERVEANLRPLDDDEMHNEIQKAEEAMWRANRPSPLNDQASRLTQRRLDDRIREEKREEKRRLDDIIREEILEAQAIQDSTRHLWVGHAELVESMERRKKRAKSDEDHRLQAVAMQNIARAEQAEKAAVARVDAEKAAAKARLDAQTRADAEKAAAKALLDAQTRADAEQARVDAQTRADAEQEQAAGSRSRHRAQHEGFNLSAEYTQRANVLATRVTSSVQRKIVRASLGHLERYKTFGNPDLDPQYNPDEPDE